MTPFIVLIPIAEVINLQYDSTDQRQVSPIHSVGSWQAVAKPMDKSLLLEREPILFYADIPLYESELDDNGASQLSVKVYIYSAVGGHFEVQIVLQQPLPTELYWLAS